MSIIFTEENDIRIDDGIGQLIIGYFTPNYRDMAEAFADNCAAVDMNVHLYAVGPFESWEDAIQAKPFVSTKAWSDHADRVVIQMDVDCIIRRSFDFNLRGDFAVSLRCKVNRKRQRQTVWPSSRILAFHGGDAKALLLLTKWKNEVYRPDLPERLSRCDEVALMRAMAGTPGLIQQLDPWFAAYEVEEAPRDAVIVHQSAHDKAREMLPRKRLKAIKRAIISRLMGRDYREWKYG